MCHKVYLTLLRCTSIKQAGSHGLLDAFSSCQIRVSHILRSHRNTSLEWRAPFYTIREQQKAGTVHLSSGAILQWTIPIPVMSLSLASGAIRSYVRHAGAFCLQ